MQLQKLQSAAVANWEDGGCSSNGTVPVTHFDNAAYRQSAYCSCYVCCDLTVIPYLSLSLTFAAYS